MVISQIIFLSVWLGSVHILYMYICYNHEPLNSVSYILYWYWCVSCHGAGCDYNGTTYESGERIILGDPCTERW